MPRAAKKKAPPKRKGKPKKARPSAASYLAALRAGRPKDELGWGVLADDVFATSVRERIPTGSLALDRLTGGGWPIGRITEVASWETVGKSTLLDQSFAEVQRMKGIASLIDVESARDEGYTEKLGVNIRELLVRPANTIEECFEEIGALLAIQEGYGKDQPPMLLVWDAVGGSPSAAERDGDAGDSHPAVAARVIKMNLRRLCLRLAKLRVALVAANHFYKSIGPYATLQTYGGTGIRYFSSLRVWLTAKGKIEVAGQQVGHVVEAKIKKTRIGRPQPPVEAGLVWGSGFDNSYSLFVWGQKAGVAADHRWIVRHGTWFYLMRPDGTHEPFQHGFAGLGQVFQAHPDLYEQMASQYLAEGRDG